jgi:myo-inositol-1(or 4)-monophosphatase
MNQINLHEVRAAVVEIVIEAGKQIDTIASRGYASRSKGGVDFATEADDATDLFLRERLKAAFPSTSFLTEETAPKQYDSYHEAENLWIIDPIDGTTNFSRGSLHYAISVGLVAHGKTKMGVIYLPKEQKMYWAQADLPNSFLNDEPIRVSRTSSMKEALLCSDWSWDIEKRKRTLGVFSRMLPNARAIQSRGCASAEIASVASGNIDAYYIYGLKPWDVAAGLLIAEKAGATIRNLNELTGEWSVFSPDLLVANGQIDHELLPYFS